MMKRVLSFILFFMFLSAANAVADYWQTYRFPCEPDYILSVPASYHVIYRGMPEGSETLKTIGITAKQADLQLEFNNSFALVYTEDFSSYISIGKFYDNTNSNFNDFTSGELEDLAAYVEEQMKNDVEANSSMTINSSSHLVQETSHAKYITIISKITLGSSNQTMVQCATNKNGYQVVLTFDCINESFLEKDINTFEAIVNSFIPL